MIAVECLQRSPAWELAKCGYLSGSHAHDVLTRGPRGGGESKSWSNYLRRLVLEQLTNIPHERREPPFVSGPMEHGRQTERTARHAYAAATGQMVHTSGFVRHDELMAGGSLDGHVGAFEGLVEIKCPNPATHWVYHVTRRVPRAYRSQITHYLWLTGAQWCDFVSYDDRLPEWMVPALVVIRFQRDDVDIAGYERAARRFLEAVHEQVAPLKGLGPVDFFRTAPMDVARSVLASCVQAVDARKRR